MFGFGSDLPPLRLNADRELTPIEIRDIAEREMEVAILKLVEADLAVKAIEAQSRPIRVSCAQN